MLAAVMSSCDAFMVSSSALFTQNIYRPFIARDRSDRHYLRVGCTVAALVVIDKMLLKEVDLQKELKENNLAVALLTPLSVACADRITAISSSNGVE